MQTAASIQHSTIPNRSLHICISPVFIKASICWSLNNNKVLQGKSSETGIVNPSPRLESNCVPEPEPDFSLARGLVLCQVWNQQEVWFVVTFQLRWAYRKQFFGLGHHLYLTWALGCFLGPPLITSQLLHEVDCCQVKTLTASNFTVFDS